MVYNTIITVLEVSYTSWRGKWEGNYSSGEWEAINSGTHLATGCPMSDWYQNSF